MSPTPQEIEYASMIALGATPPEAAARSGLPEQDAARPRVKRLVERYTKDAGRAGADILCVGTVAATRNLLALVEK